MLDPQLLELFVLLAEERHFGRAADRANLAQSTVSAKLQRLEDVIGAPLFTRRKRAAVTLTDVGRQFLVEAVEAIARLSRAEAVGRAVARGDAGPVAIGYIFSAAVSGVLPQLLALARTAFPQIKISLRQAETPEQISAVAERRLDIALVRPRQTYPAGIASAIVHREPLLLLVREDDELAGYAVVPAGALESRTFLLPQFDERAGLLEKVEELAASSEFAMPDIVRTGDFVSAASMAAAGYGIVLGPASLTRLGIQRLVSRRIEGFADVIETALCWHQKGSSATQRIVERVRLDLQDAQDVDAREAGGSRRA